MQLGKKGRRNEHIIIPRPDQTTKPEIKEGTQVEWHKRLDQGDADADTKRRLWRVRRGG